MRKMGSAEIIARGVFLVSGPEMSHAEDATSFVIHFNGELSASLPRGTIHPKVSAPERLMMIMRKDFNE
jgi:hypothetical protein